MKRPLLAAVAVLFAGLVLVAGLATAIGIEWLTAGIRRTNHGFVVPDPRLPQVMRYLPHSNPLMENGSPMHVNNYGMRRDSDIDAQPPAGTFRVLAYGDSITRGFGLTYEQTWVARLESALSESTGTRTEVLNMLPGTSPSIYAFRLRDDLRTLRPNLVLVQIELLNDLSDEALIDYESTDADGLPAMIRGGRYIASWDGSRHLHTPVLGHVFEESRIMNQLNDLVGRVRNRLRPNPLFAESSSSYFYSIGPERSLLTADEIERAFVRMFDTLDRMRTVTTAAGVPFWLLIMPSRFVFDAGVYHDSSVAWLRRAQEEASRRQMRVVSPTEALARAGGASLFVDFCHPNAGGAATLAAELQRILLADGPIVLNRPATLRQ